MEEFSVEWNKFQIRNILESTANTNPLIFLHGIKSDVLKYMLDFMYKGNVKVPEKDLSDFMKVAQELKLKGLNFEDVLNTSESDASEEVLSKKAKKDKSKERKKRQRDSNVKSNEKEHIENRNEIVDEGIYMTMKRDNLASNEDESLEPNQRQSKQKKDIKIARYQNSLKDFEIYKKNFKRKQMDDTTTDNKHCEANCCDVYECKECGFTTKFEEILKRHQLRHQLQDLQNSGLNISKENFTLPFSSSFNK